MTANEKLLRAIRDRQRKQTEFAYGILTADRYVKTLRDAIGVQACYKFACQMTKGSWASFDDVLKKAANTLVYGNADMEVKAKKEEVELPDGAELPKNTLMAFRHVLTTSRKDRDGDILRTDGAKVDPKMLLLWQHVHSLPIGKMVAVADHTKNKLELISCIVDMNELCHDAAVMVDNDMGRFSHGFRALDFSEIKEGRGEGGGGFDVKSFEIIEESLVSAPANPDAESGEVLLSLVEGGKLTSPLLKEYGKSIRDRRAVALPVKLDVSLSLNGREVESHENEPGNEAGRGETGTPKEADAKALEDEGKEGPEDQKMMVYAGMLDGSWEHVETSLRGKAKRFLLASGISVGESDWVSLVGTFPNNAIVAVEKMGMEDYKYFQVDWKMQSGKPEFVGEPKEVQIETTTEIVKRMLQLRRKSAKAFMGKTGETNGHSHTVGLDQKGNGKTGETDGHAHGVNEFVVGKANGHAHELERASLEQEEGDKSFDGEKRGRVLSKANEGKIREAVEDIKEVTSMEGVSRSAKALLRQAAGSLSAVLKSLGDEGGVEEKLVLDGVIEEVEIWEHKPKHREPTVKEAMAVVLAEATDEQFDRLKTQMEAVQQVKRASIRTLQYTRLVGR